MIGGTEAKALGAAVWICCPQIEGPMFARVTTLAYHVILQMNHQLKEFISLALQEHCAVVGLQISSVVPLLSQVHS
jgi:hypothetical protein